LARAADAGGQADANGLPVQPAPSPGEVIQQQQEQGLQQQEAQRQAVEQQRRDALAAEKVAQAA
jgi:hypothetical protein